jgi:hypothetical protein
VRWRLFSGLVALGFLGGQLGRLEPAGEALATSLDGLQGLLENDLEVRELGLDVHLGLGSDPLGRGLGLGDQPVGLAGGGLDDLCLG